MNTRYDKKSLDVSAMPEEVQEVIRYHEGLNRELVSIDRTQVGDSSDYYFITYCEPLIKGETSPFDGFFFATVSYHTWPKKETSTHYYSLDRYQLAEAMNYEPKKIPEDVEGVA